jgi:transposase
LKVYHQRSNVESTFSAIKRKFGDYVRSRTKTAQTNELLLKFVAHNLVCVVHGMHECGITPPWPSS